MQEKVNTVYNKSDVLFHTLKAIQFEYEGSTKRFKKEKQAFPLAVRSDDSVGSG